YFNEQETALRPVLKGFLREPFSRNQLLDVIVGPKQFPASSDTKTATQGQSQEHQGALVLIAEDNPTNQLLLQSYLEQLGFTVHSAANGLEAIEAVERMHYDLILMDCRMPEMDGYEATRRIRLREASLGTHVPIVAVTAQATVGEREKCLA